MRANEFINEIDRRGFLRGIGAGVTAATLGSVAPAAIAGDYRSYDTLAPEWQKVWKIEASKLSVRLERVYKRILAANPGVDKFIGHKLRAVDCPGIASHEPGHILKFDPTVFYDVSDDGIAYAMGHELSHCILQHTSLLSSLASVFSSIAVSSAASRKQEIDADVLGAELAYRAKYNPKFAFEDFSTSAKTRKKGTNDDHPNFPDREAAVNNRIAQLKAVENPATAVKPIRVEDQATNPAVEKIADLQANMVAIQKWLQVKRSIPK